MSKWVNYPFNTWEQKHSWQRDRETTQNRQGLHLLSPYTMRHKVECVIFFPQAHMQMIHCIISLTTLKVAFILFLQTVKHRAQSMSGMCPTWVIAQVWRHGGDETGLAEQFLQDRWQQWAAVTSDLSWEGLTRSHAAWWVDIARQNLTETQNVPSHIQTGVKSKSHLYYFDEHAPVRGR